jgi:predicted metal-dependent peptidase
MSNQPETETTTKPKGWTFDPVEEVEEFEKEAAARLKATRFRLEPHVLAMFADEPFYCYISRHVRKVPSDKLPTAGVTIVKDQMTMFYSQLLLSHLTDGETRFVIKHELWHLINQHLTSRRQGNPQLWNIATDLAINSLINDDSKTDAPDWVLMPGKIGKPMDYPWLRPGDPNQGKAEEKKGRTIQDVIKDLPPKMASEWYYSKILEEAKKEGAGQPGEGDSDGGFWGDANSWDDHDIWENADEQQREYYEGKVKDILRKACRHADSTNQWGSVPADMRDHIRRLISNEVDWRKLLRRFTGICQTANWSRSMKRINRKYPYVHSGRKRGRSAKLLVAVDMSGSVGDRDLELFFGEMENLAKQTTFVVAPFDTEISEDDMFEWKKGRRIQAERVRCGGTCFEAPTRYMNEHDKEYDGLLILTDGYAPQPGPCKSRRGWIITCDGQMSWESKDYVIKMRDDAEKRSQSAA